MAGVEVEHYVRTVSGIRYRLGHEGTPQLWAVELRISPVGDHGYMQMPNGASATVFVERGTLQEHGLLPRPKTAAKENPSDVKPVEELILELLSHVGVYPA